MANIDTIIKNAVKNAQITDFIMLVRNGCMTVISVEDFIKDITFGGQAVCDTLLKCWKSMGQFDGGVDPENGDNEECDCSEDFVKIHFPKGEGIKVITAEEYQKIPDSIYIRPIGTDKYSMTVVDEEGNERTPQMPEMPTVDYPVTDGMSVGNGVPIYRGLQGKKIKSASISSNGFIVREVLDPITNEPTGEISINPPGGGSSSSGWYLDTSYQRPTNWTPFESPITVVLKEGQPAVTVTTIPQGTLNDPFITYEEFLARAIGPTTGSDANGPFSKVNPRHKEVVLNILNNMNTDSDIEVNHLTIYLKNKSYLRYLGTRLYAIDIKTLWDMMPKVPGIGGSGPANVIKYPIYFSIRGEGSLLRSTGFGLIRHKTSYNETDPSKGLSKLFVGPEISGLIIAENNTDTVYTPVMLPDGTTQMKNSTVPVFGTSQAPVTPLIKIEGYNNGDWGAELIGTKLFVVTTTQVGIEADEGTMTSSLEQLCYQAVPERVGFEKKMYKTETAPGSGIYTYFPAGLTDEEKELVDRSYTDTNGYMFLKPYATRAMFVGNKSIFRIENLTTDPNGFYHIGLDSVFLLKNGSQVQNNTSYKDLGGGMAINFIRSEGASNAVSLNSGNLYSLFTNIITEDGVNKLSFFARNFIINFGARIFKTTTPGQSVDTGGTLSTILGKPIISIPDSATDNASALLAGLRKGTLYHNTTTQDIGHVN